MMPPIELSRGQAMIRTDCLMGPVQVADTEMHDSGLHTPSIVPTPADASAKLA